MSGTDNEAPLAPRDNNAHRLLPRRMRATVQEEPSSSLNLICVAPLSNVTSDLQPSQATLRALVSRVLETPLHLVSCQTWLTKRSSPAHFSNMWSNLGTHRHDQHHLPMEKPSAPWQWGQHTRLPISGTSKHQDRHPFGPHPTRKWLTGHIHRPDRGFCDRL